MKNNNKNNNNLQKQKKTNNWLAFILPIPTNSIHSLTNQDRYHFLTNRRNETTASKFQSNKDQTQTQRAQRPQTSAIQPNN